MLIPNIIFTLLELYYLAITPKTVPAPHREQQMPNSEL